MSTHDRLMPIYYVRVIMAKISKKLYNFSKNLFNTIGLGNDKFVIAIGIAITFSLLALIGFYVPPLITAINLISALMTCGITFMAISLLSGLNPIGLLIGLVLGAIMGGITFALSSSMIAIAPAITLLLALPNVVAAGAYLLGGICSAIENCFSFCFGSNKQSRNNHYSSNYTAEVSDYTNGYFNNLRSERRRDSELSGARQQSEVPFFQNWKAAPQQRDIGRGSFQASESEVSRDTSFSPSN